METFRFVVTVETEEGFVRYCTTERADNSRNGAGAVAMRAIECKRIVSVFVIS
jgi:hypothetical protein